MPAKPGEGSKSFSPLSRLCAIPFGAVDAWSGFSVAGMVIAKGVGPESIEGLFAEWNGARSVGRRGSGRRTVAKAGQAAGSAAIWRSSSSRLAQPPRYNWIISQVRLLGLRPAQSVISKLVIKAT
jgi:hypothetical protein